MSNEARPEELTLLFTAARTHSAWLPDPVDDETLRRIYELARWAPTGSNASPLRIVFARSPAAKERLKPALAPMNVEKVMTAPVTAILAYDVAWHDHLPLLASHRPGAREQIAALPEERRDLLGRVNAQLQAGYFILAARACGLDCGPIGGFDPAKVDAEFFPDGAWRTIMPLVNLGHGDPAKTQPRMPRLEFATACRVL
ncbi:MAG TPA: malonic semialdehyde reductase [Polyangia bacterium]|jgi:3-hydroxypropanoate dehydrogenase|nr:malonic semialdehyde reductase [Polyangia bacterium]